jgi:uncharacterized membrane protein
MKAKKASEKIEEKNEKKAQTSIEFLVILGIALLVIVVGITISQNLGKKTVEHDPRFFSARRN